MILNQADLIECASNMVHYLVKRGFEFNSEGFPLIPRECYLAEWPDVIVDYSHRNGRLVKDKAKTLICLFSSDQRLLPRLERNVDDLSRYESYMGVGELDITVTKDMDIEYQEFVMLVNALHMAVIASAGYKVVPSTRCGVVETQRLLSFVPRGVMWLSSTLGCSSLQSDADNEYIQKVLSVHPSKVAIYGKSDQLVEEQLSRMGFDWRGYPDTHSAYSSMKGGER